MAGDSRSRGDDVGTRPREAMPAQASRWIPRALLSVGVGVLLTSLLVWSGFPLVPRWDAMRAMDPGWAIACELCILAAFVVRAARMRHLTRPLAAIELREIFAIEWWSHAANFVVPFRLGELARPTLYAARAGIPIAAAVSSMLADRLLEGLVLLVLLAVAIPVGAPIQPLPTTIGDVPVSTVFVPVLAYLVIAAYVATFVVLLVLRRAPRLVAGPLSWIEGRSRGRTRRGGDLPPGDGVQQVEAEGFTAKLMRASEQLAEGLSFLQARRVLALYLGEILGYWLLSAASVACLAWALGIDDFSLVRGWAVLGTIALGMVLPAAPGYLGSYQAAGYAGLALYLPATVVLGPGADLIAIGYALSWIHMAIFAVLATWMGPPRGGQVDSSLDPPAVDREGSRA